ncbi:MAG: deoxyribose-phosphate aldolase [Fimbriimonas sp.]
MKTSDAPIRPDSVDSVARLIDHTILHPTVTEAEIRADLAQVRGIPVASLCIKPYALGVAREVLEGTGIPLCTVVGFPQGTSRPDVKAFEADRAFDDGAVEIDMVVNVALVRAEDWDGVRADVAAVQNVCEARGGLLKVIFETDFLPEDALKIRLCEICTDLNVGFVKTSTGFGYVKTADGHFATKGAQEADLRLMRAHCAPKVGVKASGGVRTLDQLLKCVEAGANRVGTTSTYAILAEAKERFHG